jgi:hypothetical protein
MKMLAEEDEFVYAEGEVDILGKFPTKAELDGIFEEVRVKEAEWKKLGQPERHSDVTAMLQMEMEKRKGKQKEKEKEKEREKDKDRDGKKMNVLDRIMLRTQGLSLQEQLEEIWTMLEMHPVQQIEMLIKYTTPRMTQLINYALTLWNVIAEIIIEREEQLYQWAMVESNVAKMAVSKLSPKMCRRIRMRRRRMARRVIIITRYCRSFAHSLLFYCSHFYFSSPPLYPFLASSTASHVSLTTLSIMRVTPTQIKCTKSCTRLRSCMKKHGHGASHLLSLLL